MPRFVLVVDAGTTSIRCILFDHDSNQLAVSQKPITQHYPEPGWVEHDPVETWEACRFVIKDCLSKSGIDPRDCVACGITNQRETTVVWDRDTGKPVCNAIVWQDRRTAETCKELDTRHGEYIRKTTGLKVDSYFSGTKISWMLNNVEGVREKAEKGELMFGNIDSWLMWNLTGRKVHATDVSNASRTMLFDIRKLEWDRELLKILDIPESMLPDVCPSGHMFGNLDVDEFGIDAPISGVIGDQQSSLFGQTCFDEGDVKITFGTGGFLLMNLGSDMDIPDDMLLRTVAWTTDCGTDYAVEGSIYIAGAAVEWLRNGLGIVSKASDVESLARSVNDTEGCYIVPAFVGLGAPYWDPDARGTIVGITRGTTKAHIARAALESIAYQSYDVIKAMEDCTGTKVDSIKVDGGACRGDILCQFLADMTECVVRRPTGIEATAFGAASMAGLTVGFWKNEDELRNLWKLDREFVPDMSESERDKHLKGWAHAVACSRLR